MYQEEKIKSIVIEFYILLSVFMAALVYLRNF